MKGELIKINTEDNLILHGMYCKVKESKTVIIHIHGSYGNFYENFFLDEMAAKYNQLGISFLSISTRGKDYFSDFKKLEEGKYNSIRLGGIREIFQDSLIDIKSWVNFTKNKGYKRIILQGHSLGAMKAVFFNKNSNAKIDGLILLSPPDNLGLQKLDNGEKFLDYKKVALELTKKDENSLMPSEAFFDPITSSSFTSLLKENDTGMFTYSNVELMKKAGMSFITCPLLITFATINEAIINPIENCINSIEKSISNKELLQISVIKDANHNYHFKEEKLVKEISNWLIATF